MGRKVLIREKFDTEWREPWEKLFILPKIARGEINAKIGENTETVPKMLFLKAKLKITEMK